MVSMDPEKAKLLLGAGDRKFISQSELEEIQAARGKGDSNDDDGSGLPQRPLAEILKERKEAKDADHQEKWKQMKVGKNRPLEEDELDFLDSLAEVEVKRKQEEKRQEEAELEAFRQMKQIAQEKNIAEIGPSLPPDGSGDDNGVGGAASQRNNAQTITTKQQQSNAPLLLHQQQPKRPLVIVQAKASSKKKKTDTNTAAPVDNSKQEEQLQGLTGLLGSYGSDSDS